MDHDTSALRPLPVVLDLRSLSPETLLSRLPADWAQAPDALLTIARRPHKRWTRACDFAHPLILSSAPQYEMILWIRPEQLPSLPPEVRREHDRLLQDYKSLFDSSVALEVCPRWNAYRQLVLEHISRQENSVFPELRALLPELERPLRELGYEHRGLEKGLHQLEDVLRSGRQGVAQSKARETIDLDFYHLLEHHLEREAEAIYPAWYFLRNERKKG